ncbi:MAG: hypothetical protein IKM73_13755 [Acidaminococcaceae bacterium]|nr:hypothetical protein [Acidaminococcaceae bacterium]
MPNRLDEHRAAIGANLRFRAAGSRAGPVARGGQGLQMMVVADHAAVIHQPRTVAGGGNQQRPPVPAVAGGFRVVRHIAVPAAGADMGAKAGLRAGGRGDDGGIAVAQRVGVIGSVMQPAALTGAARVPHRLAAGFGVFRVARGRIFLHHIPCDV